MTEVHCPLVPQVSPLPYSPMGESVSLVSSPALLPSQSKLDEPVVACEPEEGSEPSSTEAKASVVDEDASKPAPEFVPPMRYKTEYEQFFDRFRTVIECLQKPFPNEDPAQRDKREDLVSHATDVWTNFDDLPPLEKIGWTSWAEAWEAFFKIN